MKENIFVVIDGQSYIYRAFYAIKGLSNSKGIPVNAILGFVNILTKTIRQFNPTYIACAFDCIGASSSRRQIYKDYKSTRPSMPKELSIQIPFIKKIISSHNIWQFEQEGLEADDIIASIVNKIKNIEGIKIIIATGDKDMLQLVCENVVVYDITKDVFFSPEKVVEKIGIASKYLVDFFSLTGDTTDNIPGVQGIGKKTAASLISQFGTLENLYNHCSEIKNSNIQKKLINGKESAFLSKKLLSMRVIDIDFDISNAKLIPPNGDELIQIYKELELKKLEENLEKSEKEHQATINFGN